MIDDIDFKHMLVANKIRMSSNCARRQIGAVIPNKSGSTVGVNQVNKAIHCCKREQGICPAIHAEVEAIMHLNEREKAFASSIYVWAETPCHACLSFIRKHSYIDRIVCLSTESYSKDYPRVLEYKEQIALRDEYAKKLGLDVVKLDREEVLHYADPDRKQVW